MGCGHLSAMMAATDNGTLIAELDRLLELGEPLLNVFPKQESDDWPLELPDNISPEMERYADDVASRAEDRKRYQVYYQQKTTHYLAKWVKESEAGLLGWRAIGVLK